MNEPDNIPPTAKWVADFINRIGFPIFVAIVAMALLWKQMEGVQKAYEINSDKVVAAVNKNTDAITALRHFLTHKYE